MTDRRYEILAHIRDRKRIAADLLPLLRDFRDTFVETDYVGDVRARLADMLELTAFWADEEQEG